MRELNFSHFHGSTSYDGTVDKGINFSICLTSKAVHLDLTLELRRTSATFSRPYGISSNILAEACCKK